MTPGFTSRLVTYRLLLLVTALLAGLSGCSRQFSVTVNNQSIYDPRRPEGSREVVDPSLQGCINLALAQSGAQVPAELTVLSCAAAAVEDLQGIGQLVNLRFLDLAQNAVSDLQPLTALPQLTGLSIPDNPIDDIAPLLGISSLTAVILTGNQQIPCSQLDRLEQRLGPNLTRPQRCRG